MNTILDFPMITKSRPINGNNENNILLNLDKARHFISVKDTINYSEKKNVMIGRAGVFQEHRIKFYAEYFNNPLKKEVSILSSHFFILFSKFHSKSSA